MFKYQISNSNSLLLLLFMLLLASCLMMMMGFTPTVVLVESASSSCGGGCVSILSSSNSTTSVQSYWEVIDKEIIELTCHQQKLLNALSLLKINSTLNAEIISMRTKQIDRITKSISLLTQESTFLKLAKRNVTIISNGQVLEYNDGTRGKSCREYRNPIKPFLYNNEGSGLYNIEPSNGLILTVYCDMITDGGGWTLISGIRSDHSGIHFHTFEDSTAISTPTTFTSFHIKTSALLTISTQVRAAHDISANPATTFYQSSWPYSAYCTITQALRNAIQISPTINNGDLPTSCAVLTGSFSTVPTHFTYGKTPSGSDPNGGHSTGFRLGIPDPSYSGHFLVHKSYTTFSFNGAPEGFSPSDIRYGVYFTFAAGEYGRNGAVYLR